jgi:hypothetical protein
MNITGRADHLTRGTSMGWIERVRRRLRERPAKSAAPPYRRTARDDEDEEVAELLAIEII